MNGPVRAFIGWGAGLFLLVLLGILLYRGFADRPNDLQAVHDLAAQQLLIDSQFRESLLRNRHGVAHNYDAMINRHAALRKGAALLKSLPVPVSEIRAAIQAYEDFLQQESEQLETFKSLNAAVRNATRYYQFEALRLIETLADTPANRQLKRKLQAFALDAALLAAGGVADAVQPASAAVELELAAAAARIPAQGDTFLRLIKHGQRIAAELPKLQAATRELLRNERHSQLVRIQQLADGMLVRERVQAQHQQQLLGGLALLLLLALATVARRRMRDVAMRLKTEEKLRELSQAVEQSPNIIVVTDLEGNIQYVNAALAKITGYAPAEVIGANMRALRSGKTPPATYRELWQTLRAGEIWQGEFINRRKDGSEYVGAAVIGPVRRADGSIAHYVGVQEDVTERKQIEAELARHREHLEDLVEQRTTELSHALAAAESANTAKSAFLATMSHEIRTPLNGILGMAQMLLMTGVDETERRDFARTILNSGQTLLTLLNDILDFSKIEAGRLELELAAVDPAQLLQETASLFQESAFTKGLQLDLQWHGPAQHYQADAHRLRQMLSNLTNNAIKFTSQGSVSLHAREVERSGERSLLEFSVIDTGIGIDDDKQALLFKPFSQADASITRQFGGTGLGLSIVRSLAEKMGGGAGVDSTPGQGSRFWFRIRADLVSPGTDRRHSARGDGDLPLSAAGLSGNILVVEDNRTNQKVVQALLNKLGLACQLAPDGQAGVQAVIDDPSIDLILMDLQMPILDGLAATSAIRSFEARHARAAVPVVAYSSASLGPRILASYGLNGSLPKPCEDQELEDCLVQWCPTYRSNPTVRRVPTHHAGWPPAARPAGTNGATLR